MNKRRKGAYYRRKTKQWLEEQGYTVMTTEISTKRKTHDVFGCDLMAMNGKHLVGIQVKSNKGDISKGVKELKVWPWPKCKCIKLWVVHWPTRAKEPVIREVK